MKTRIIHTKIWQDEWFCSLSRSSSLIFLYLLTCQENNLSGIFELPDRNICFNARVTEKELEASKKELAGKVAFYNGWIRIINSNKYQIFTGEKNEIAKEKEIKIIPPEILDTLSIEYRYPIDSLSNHKSEIRNQKSIISNKNIEQKDFEEIAEKYKVPKSFVLSKWDDLQNYCSSTGKKYKNYKAALMSWVKKDSIKIKKEVYEKSKLAYI